MRSLTLKYINFNRTHHVRDPASLEVDVEFGFCSDFLTLLLNKNIYTFIKHYRYYINIRLSFYSAHMAPNPGIKNDSTPPANSYTFKSYKQTFLLWLKYLFLTFSLFCSCSSSLFIVYRKIKTVEKFNEVQKSVVFKDWTQKEDVGNVSCMSVDHKEMFKTELLIFLQHKAAKLE